MPILHPFLFAAYPLLFMLSKNRELFTKVFFIETIAWVAVGTFLCWIVLKIVLRNGITAGLVISLFFIWLFFYHPFYHSLLKITTVSKLLIWRNSIVIPLWTLIILYFGYIILKKPSRAVVATKTFNLISVVLVSWCLLYTTYFFVKGWFFDTGPRGYYVSTNDMKIAPPSQIGEYPDIYCIMLDSYTSNTVLEEVYNFSNTEFLNALVDRGFYVLKDAKSNYPNTTLSMMTLFNMEYHDKVWDEKDWWKDLCNIANLRGNRVALYLVSKGYTFINRQEIESEDPHILKFLFFEGIMRLSLLFDLTRVYNFLIDDLHYTKILKDFKWLQNIEKFPDPIFVYAPIFCPHEPFVFNASGGKVGLLKIISLARNYLKQHNYNYTDMLTNIERALYVEQLQFVNQETIRAIDAIISNSARPPIIIILGDHGFRQAKWKFDLNDRKHLRQHFGVLQAYYFPDKDYSKLYEEITHVNIFRLLLQQYFKESVPLLEDKSYILRKGTAYDVTKTIQSN